jgi:hypothetical protein
LVVKKGSKIRGSDASGNALPSSAKRITHIARACGLDLYADMPMVTPVNQQLLALFIRLVTTCTSAPG